MQPARHDRPAPIGSHREYHGRSRQYAIVVPALILSVIKGPCFWLARCLLGHAYLEVGYRLPAVVAGADDADDVMARLREAVNHLGVAPRIMRLGVAVRSHFGRLGTVAEIPCLIA